MKPILVADARPNFAKVALVFGTIDKHNGAARSKLSKTILVRASPHDDYEMS